MVHRVGPDPPFPERDSVALASIPAIAAFINVVTADHGLYGYIPYLGQFLILGRVYRLSLVFAHVFAIQAFIGIVYAFHVKEKAHHIASLLYVAGSFGCTFAGDYISLFVFWELMSVSSTFLIWLRRNPVSTRAGFRYFLFHTLGGLFLLAGLLLRYKAVGNFSFEWVNQADAQFYDWLILIGFAVNAAAVPLHAWLPDAYPEATVPGAVFLCAFTKDRCLCSGKRICRFDALAIAGTVMAVYGVLYAAIETTRGESSYTLYPGRYMVPESGIGTAMT
jgi:multicomponent Na+:H+ antiporter subunit D